MKDHGIIFRTALTQKMKEKSAKKNLYITAPGGYGKTVAATQLFASVRGLAARLTIDSSDNDPGLFYRRLSCLLLKLTAKKNNAPETEHTLDGLLEMLHLLPEKNPRCYLALDDYHMIQNKELLSSLPLIVGRLPSYVCLCLISRKDPSAALLKTGRFEVFAKNSLLFSPDEIEWLGEERDYHLTPAQITELYERTGGWVMYLSAILSGGKQTFAPDGDKPKTLLQYLDTRVWGLWDRDIKELLLRLSIPNEVNPELCECLLGIPDGRGILMRLAKKENAFLSCADGDTYRFHDIFREFLLERTDRQLGADETRRLNDMAAGWYYEQGDYFASVRHYINSHDHEGIVRCMRENNRFRERAGSMSVEARLNFNKQYVLNLTQEFISENPYLLSECVLVAFYDGDGSNFTRYIDMLYQKLAEIAEKYPDLYESAGFIGSLDFRIPLQEYARAISKVMPLIRNSAQPEASANTITQNFPFFHRSMRDFSEYHDLREDDIKLLRDTFGAMIGKDYIVMEESLLAGICYERGELLEATRHALNAYHAIAEDMQPETVFSSRMILASVLYAIGSSREANRMMERTEAFVEQTARFLYPNFKALQTERAIRNSDLDAAREWLTVYASRSESLAFYQTCRHFTTLRAYIVLENYKEAIVLGNRLQTLAHEYKRPLDQIESGLLTVIALWYGDEKSNAVKLLEQTVNTAIPYGFVQLFINEGKAILPLLWALRGESGKSDTFLRFVDSLTGMIYAEHDFEPAKEQSIQLTEKQRTMLSYLNKDMSYQTIADELGIGRGTVKTHVLQLYRRLSVHNAQEAVVKAKMLGLL